MLVEMLSQFYRSVIPITPWVNFLLDDEHGGQWFSVVLLILYTVGKVGVSSEWRVNGCIILQLETNVQLNTCFQRLEFTDKQPKHF